MSQRFYQKLKKFYKHLKRVNKSEASYDFIQGTLRQVMFKYTPFLLTNYLKVNYEKRKVNARACLENQECLYCSCKTPDMFMANRACKKPNNPCYTKLIPFRKRLLNAITNYT